MSYTGRRAFPAAGDAAIDHHPGMRWSLVKRPPDEATEQLAGLISSVLHEPMAKARKIAQASIEERRRSRKLWQQLADATPAEACDLAASIDAPGLDDVADYLTSSRRGAVVTTVHGGGYMLGLLRLRWALDSSKRIIVVRRRAESDLERQVFAKFSRPDAPLEVVRHDQSRAITLVRALRAGEIVVALCDLPASYGATREVELLGLPMHLVCGPVALAVQGHSDLVPLFCQRQDPRLISMSCRALLRPHSIDEGMGVLSRYVTEWIREYPGQWQHWFHLPAMLDPMLPTDAETAKNP